MQQRITKTVKILLLGFKGGSMSPFRYRYEIGFVDMDTISISFTAAPFGLLIIFHYRQQSSQ